MSNNDSLNRPSKEEQISQLVNSLYQRMLPSDKIKDKATDILIRISEDKLNEVEPFVDRSGNIQLTFISSDGELYVEVTDRNYVIEIFSSNGSYFCKNTEDVMSVIHYIETFDGSF